MTAKQTLSASLGVLLLASTPALADEPEPDAVQPSGEVHPEQPAHIVIEPPPAKPVLMPKREPTGTFSVGAGYSSDDGFIASARVAQDSLFGTGKKLAMTSTISKRWMDFRVRYEDPGMFGSQLQLRGDLYSTRKHYSTFFREAVGGDLQLKRRIAPHLDVYAGYKLERVEVEHDPVTMARGQPVEQPWNGGWLGAVRAGLEYSTVDLPDAEYPRRGTKVGAQIEVADRDLGSDLNYLRTDAWISHHRPLGPLTLHLAGRVSSISDVPLSERLHFDGSSDIRGYAPGSLLATGGNFMWTGRAELEAPLIPCADLNIAGFVDAGGLYSPTGGAGAMSAGFGLIWRSPIGPLRFDVAYPLDGDGKPRYVFGIGGMF